MKMKFTFKYTLIGVLALSLTTACTSTFDDINTNHHEATDEMLETDNLKVGSFFTQMQERVVLFDDGTGKSFSSDYQVSQGLSHATSNVSKWVCRGVAIATASSSEAVSRKSVFGIEHYLPAK